MMLDDPKNKKRNRLSLSCNYCKRRKVKCDRGRPCSSCARYNVGHLCDYPEPVWSEPAIIQGNTNQSSNSDNGSSGSNGGSMSAFSVQRFHPSSPVTSNNMGSQTTFHVPTPTMTSAAPTVNNIINDIQSPQTTGVHSELEELKNKIRLIEASLDKKSTDSPPAPQSGNQHLKRHHSQTQSQLQNKFHQSQLQPQVQIPTPPPPHPIGSTTAVASPPPLMNHPHIYSKYNSPPDSAHIPIKLPPIHWDPNKAQSSNTGYYIPRVENKHEHNFNWDDFKYNIDTNPTYVGINPFGSNEEEMNFYVGYTPIHIRDTSRRMNYGPFSWLSIMKKDSGLKALWLFMAQKKSSKAEVIRQTIRTEKLPLGSQLPSFATNENFKPKNTPSGKSMDSNTNKLDSESEFREKAIDRDGYNDLRLYGNVSKVSSSVRGNTVEKVTPPEDEEVKRPKDDKVDNERVLMNKHAISLGLTVFEGKIDQELQLIEKIQVILPKQKVIWTLINKFFLYMYPYMPFIDEIYFKQEMARILGPEGYADDPIQALKVEKRLDFANIGILLLILRFTYLSLFSNRNGVNENNLNSNDPSTKAQELKYLLSNPVNIDLISMAQLCLDQFELLRKTSLVVLQCAFFMRLYHMFSPEDGDGGDGGDSQIFNGMLVQMAYSMGINREPDTFDDICNDDKVNNLGRKIWFFLMISDLIQAYQYGNPLSINEKYFDTSLPYYKTGNQNINDVEMEKHVISTFAYFNKYYYKLVAILDVCLDIRKFTKLSQLTNLISDFEIHLSEHYGTLNKFMVPFQEDKFKYPFIKTMKCKNYINMKGFLLSLFFHLYLYYESNNKTDFSYFYLKKIFSISTGEFIPNYFNLILDNDTNFGEAADLILNPSIETMIHKTSQMNFAILVRINSTIHRMKNDPDHVVNLRNNFVYKFRYSKLCKISKILEFITKYCIAALSRLSQRYYYAWRVTKAHSFLLKLISGEELYVHSKNNPRMEFLNLTTDQLNELIFILENSVKKFGKSKIGHASTELIDEYNEELDISHPSTRFKDNSSLNVNVANNVDNDAPSSSSATAAAAAAATATTSGSSSAGNGATTNHNGSISSSKSYQTTATPFSHATHHSIPSSVDSNNNSELDDIQFLENAEIDKLWYQMASMKYNGSNASNNNNNPNNGMNNDFTSTSHINNAVEANTGLGAENFTISIPTPSMNPLSPESLSNPQVLNGNNNNNNKFDPVIDIYNLDAFNNLPIDQIFGLRNDQEW
ncbi:hypothetical protein DFJ63DRAFT_319444 [Scheffersomyces coipomensis]|uniref:uncharacterized protein n=1 Tax=Scheffersomyces coipomensis TaxID=1788519 RepID=UPI00315DA93B